MNFTTNRLSLATLLLSLALLIGAGVVLAGDVPVAAQQPVQAQLPDGVASGGYYLTAAVDTDFDTTVANLRAALAGEGFGVLTEVDMQAKFAEKLEVEIPRYLILGACNPPLAYEVYQQENWIGILLPCNFVIRELADGTVSVAAQNPQMLPQATGNADLMPLASDLADKVGRVLAAL